MSKQGARLFADGVDTPDQFDLLISGDKGIRRGCQVVWRLGGEIGVAFVGPSGASIDPLSRLRNDGHHLDLDQKVRMR
jgi:hypothetical protein